MDPSSFIDTITTDPTNFTDITHRLAAAHVAGAQSWTDDGICSAVGIIIGDYDLKNLTNNQTLRISVLINSFWAPYPVHLSRSIHGATRKSVLNSYLEGHYLDVAALCGHDPTLATSASTTPADNSAPPAPPPSFAATPPPTASIFESLAAEEPNQGTYRPSV